MNGKHTAHGKYKATLVRLSSTNNNLRTREVTGFFDKLPDPGSAFCIVGEPLEAGHDFRLVRTSTVRSIYYDKDGCFVFETQNSVYELWLESMEPPSV